MSLKMINWISQLHLPGANELTGYDKYYVYISSPALILANGAVPFFYLNLQNIITARHAICDENIKPQSYWMQPTEAIWDK